MSTQSTKNSLRRQQAQLELLRRNAWRDFYVFAKFVAGMSLMEEVPHRELCEFLMLGLDKSDILNIKDCVPPTWDSVKEMEGTLKKLVMLPRNSFKSSVVSTAYVCWLLWRNPNLRIMIDSETLGNAKMYLAGIKDLMANNPMMRLVCVDEKGEYVLEPNKKLAGGFVEDQIILAHRTRVGLKEPTIFCSGVDNARTGMHPDVIIMDDLVSERNVSTKDQLTKVEEHYKYSLSLLEVGGGLQLVVGTRYHMADLYGALIASKALDTLVRPAINTANELYFPTRLTREFLSDMRKEQGSYIYSCNPKGAPVLMADWTFKDVSEIKTGDVVMGFERATDSTERSRLTPTKVTAAGSKPSPVQRVIFEDGTEIRCTPDHRWFTGRRQTEKEPTRKEYLPARVGGRLMNVTQVWREEITTEERIAYAYLAGMIDGEGAVRHGSITITQDETHNPHVCKRIEEVLNFLKITYRKYTKKNTRNHMYVLSGGRDTKLRILRFANMGKAADLSTNMYKNSGQPISSKDKVVSIIPDGEETVYSFQTETGNYVIWGYMSKNCQYMLDPVNPDDAMFSKEHLNYIEDMKTPPVITDRYITIDPAISQKQTADYSVIMVVGVDAEKRRYVESYTRERMTPFVLIDKIFETAENTENVRKIGIELVAYQKMLMYAIKDEMRRRGKYLPMQELKADMDKIRRARMIQPAWENDDIYVKRSHTDLIRELTEFPFSEHDDTVDALAYTEQLLNPYRGTREKRPYEYNPINTTTNY